MKPDLHLAIDTSNYTTSVAVVQGQEVVYDCRQGLRVKAGSKGLRQSEALYQHWQNLPSLLAPALRRWRGQLTTVTASDRPRPREGSYMPVFEAGVGAATLLSEALACPLFFSSHQEGHLQAAAQGIQLPAGKAFLAGHLSGGTTELLLVDPDGLTVIGQTLDLSYGQLIDRVGLLLGLDFPAGPALDRLALSWEAPLTPNPFKAVHRKGNDVNLSGMEQQAEGLVGVLPAAALARALLTRLAENLTAWTDDLMAQYGLSAALLTGGVACSQTLRSLCSHDRLHFGNPAYCSDNAVGLALMKGKKFCPSKL